MKVKGGSTEGEASDRARGRSLLKGGRMTESGRMRRTIVTPPNLAPLPAFGCVSVFESVWMFLVGERQSCVPL